MKTVDKILGYLILTLPVVAIIWFVVYLFQI